MYNLERPGMVGGLVGGIPRIGDTRRPRVRAGRRQGLHATVDRVPAAQRLPRQAGDLAKSLELVRLTESLLAAPSLQALAERYLAGSSRLLGVGINGFDVVDPETTRPIFVAPVGVSDAFLARYRGTAWIVDPMRAAVYATGRPAYNMELMSSEAWLDSEAYRDAFRLHRMRHVVEVPVPSAGRIVGHLSFARIDPARDFFPEEIRVAEALGHVLGLAIGGMNTREQLTRERDQALAALDLVGTAIVISDPEEPELRLNDAARRLFSEVVDAEQRLHQLLARPLTGGAFSRRVDVELVTGETGVLHAHANPSPHPQGGLVAVVELGREQPGIAPGAIAALTPREREVAALVVHGYGDREIAKQLYLSRHTVSQHVKSIYRKLNVNSRVGLTRLLLGRRR
jgi:DNA-binding CsgD family transcriptional regulator/GAF domain-containing protein